MSSKQKIWISKYALSKAGITEHLSEIKKGSAYPGDPFASFTSFVMGIDAHETKEAACDAAEKQRVKKIASLKKQLAALEKLSFS